MIYPTQMFLFMGFRGSGRVVLDEYIQHGVKNITIDSCSTQNNSRIRISFKSHDKFNNLTWLCKRIGLNFQRYLTNRIEKGVGLRALQVQHDFGESEF